MSDFVLRTVRSGRVKIGNKYYSPRDGKFKAEGKFVFACYKGRPFVYLWGTEKMNRDWDADSQEGEEVWNEYCAIMEGNDPWWHLAEVAE